MRHEQQYVESLKSKGFAVTVVEGAGVDNEAIAQTRAAMEGGAEIIVQGAFRSGAWIGRTDGLRRINSPSLLGPWSYEVIDTKLARQTESGSVLQLCLYAELLADAQGVRPSNGYVVAPNSGYEPQAYRTDDYGAYFRRVRLGLVEAINDRGKEETYPDPKAHCDICRWKDRCERRRREDDHLSLVANASKLQIEELQRRGVETVAALAAMPLPLVWKPSRGAAQSYERIREQARIQVAGREAGRLVYELLPVNPGFGLACLPEPSPGDVFFDLEGDPFVGEGGLEYLFGYACYRPDGFLAYNCDWAFSREEEKSAFERFVDFVIARLKTHPDLHIYYSDSLILRILHWIPERRADASRKPAPGAVWTQSKSGADSRRVAAPPPRSCGADPKRMRRRARTLTRAAHCRFEPFQAPGRRKRRKFAPAPTRDRHCTWVISPRLEIRAIRRSVLYLYQNI